MLFIRSGNILNERIKAIILPELTSKTVKCQGAELLQLLPQLQADGWRVTMLIVKNVADYEVRAIRQWEKPKQQDLLIKNESGVAGHYSATP